MDQQTRNKLRNVVTQCRKLMEESIAQQLEGQFGIRAGIYWLLQSSKKNYGLVRRDL